MGIRQVGVLHGLTKLVAADAAGMTDGQLLRRFASTRDDGAFAALIQRHGPLVYGVCRNVLRHEQDAEDAFQATFLVLARRAGAVREGLALGGWLYRVAFRVATKARLAAERRRRREARQPRSEEDRPVGDLGWRELQAMLDEELNRLPEKYRAPFVLCVLSGKSKPEAAAELGWKEGTVSSRLATAREKLRVRLLRRGVTLSAILSGLAIAAHGTASALPVALAETTRKAAVAYALGQAVAAGPAALARAVLRGMSLARLRHLGITVALVAVAGTVAVASHPWRHAPEGPPPPEPALTANSAPAPDPGPDPGGPAAKETTFFGAVTDETGKPVANARVMASVGFDRPSRDIANAARFDMPLLGDGRTDGEGKYRFTAPLTDPARNHRLTFLAKAPGYGYAFLFADPGNKIEALMHVGRPLVLAPGRPAKARLLDPDGQPARGVTVHLVGMRGRDADTGILYYAPPVPLPEWPGPFRTAADGSFTVPDVIPGTILFCQTRDPRYAPEWTRFQARSDDKGSPPTIKLNPARVLSGRVLAGDSGRPLAGATVVVESPAAARELFVGYMEAKTDADGRYTIQPFPGRALKVTAYPAAGAPYPVLIQDLAWPAGAARRETDLTIPRGVLITGAVEDAGSGRKVAGAVVEYKWADRFQDPPERTIGTVSIRSAVTGADGAFAIAVPPGAGHLVVRGPNPDYLHTEIPSALLRGYGKGGSPVFPDAVVPLKLEAGADPQTVTLRLRRGVTVHGRVVGTDGKPVARATLFAIHYRPKGMDAEAQGLSVADGRFELPGCPPGTKVPVWVYDATSGLAAFAELPADPAAEPVVRLAPTVAARARVVDQFGLPIQKPTVLLAVLMREGANEQSSRQTGAPARIIVSAKDVHGTEADYSVSGHGDVVLPGLIPGAKYSVAASGGPGDWSESKTFTAPATGTLDLGRLSTRSIPRVPFRVGQLYYYRPVAVDPDGDPVTITLVEGPPGMRMDPETGALIWVPKPGQEGDHKVTLKATDRYGASALQTFRLRIAP